MRAAGRNAQPPGEGLGDGLGDRSRRLMSGTWLWKDLEGQEDLVEPSSTPSPVGRRIASRIPPGQDHARGGAQSTQQTHTLKHPSQSKRSITSFSAQKFANTAWAFAMASQRDANTAWALRCENSSPGCGYRSSIKSHLGSSWSDPGAAADSGPPRRWRDAAKTPHQGAPGPPNIKRITTKNIQYVL